MLLPRKTQTWRALFLVGAVLGLISCATPTVNPWETIEVDSAPTEQPLPLPDFPVPTEFTKDYVVFDLAGAQELEAFRVVSHANTEVAQAHANQVDSYKDATQHLVEAGKSQRRIAEMRQEMLEDERQHNFFTSIGYWAVIIGLGVAASD